MDTLRLRKELVNTLREKGYLHRDDVAEAFLKVKREDFIWSLWERENGKWKSYPVNKETLDPKIAERIYKDESIPIVVENENIVCSSSQPAVMSVMIEEGDIRKGDKVLEIGTGSGYNAAILHEIVGREGKVVTTEVNETVYNLARASFKKSGIYEGIIALKRNAIEGVPEHAPFDVIIVTSSTPEIPHIWFDELKTGGRIIMPYVIRGSEILIKLTKLNDDILFGEGIYYVVFTRLRGVSATKHFPLFQNEFISLKEIIEDYAIKDKHLSHAFNELSRSQKHDFALFVSIHSTDSFAMLTDDDKKVYGIIKEQGDGMGVVAILEDKVIKWGSHSAYYEFKNMLEKWKNLGKPGLKDYKIIFTKKKATSGFLDTEINFVNFI